MAGVPLRPALDQNFPVPLLRSMSEWLPGDVHLDHIASVDQRLSGLDDRELIIALRQLGFDGLVTNNWRMLNIPREIAAIVATKSVVVATRDMGDDALRAAGALMLELPGLRSRILPNRSNVFLLSYARRRPEDAWEYLRRAAEHEGTSVQELWQAVRVTEEELTTVVLPEA